MPIFLFDKSGLIKFYVYNSFISLQLSYTFPPSSAKKMSDNELFVTSSLCM